MRSPAAHHPVAGFIDKVADHEIIRQVGKLVAVRADGAVLDPESARSVTPEAGRF
jgi:hypothetical protein